MSKPLSLTIIQDQPCSVCGQAGGTVQESGLCFGCMEKRLAGDLSNWPDVGGKFMEAPEVELMAKKTMFACPEMRWLLEDRVQVYYQFQREMSKTKAGNCSQVPERYADLIPYHFMITVCWTKWKGLGPEARERLVYHQLCHISRDGETLEWALRSHDFEGFIPELHGILSSCGRMSI